MATVLLVHGAWHGGWCWAPVTQLLRAAGHDVWTPTLTGVGERAHLADPSIDLDVHRADLLGVLEYEQLEDVTLVGHSYAGMLIEGVARSSQRVSSLLFVDAFMPDHGESAFDLLPEEIRERMQRKAHETGNGWRIPPSDLEGLGVEDPAALEWLTPRLVPQPLGTYNQPADLLRGEDRRLPTAFVLCTEWKCVFRPYAERARERGYPVAELATGHEAMATAPNELAGLIDRFVSEGS